MRLGFVGVGRHAQKMAAAFRECGAEIYGHDRKSKYAPVANAFAQSPSEPMSWADQIASPNIDALIICAPPEVTTEVALACAKAGKRCVATKPLMWATHVHAEHCPFPGSPGYCARCHSTIGPGAARCEAGGWEQRHMYVDLWRLYSPAWLALKAELRGNQIQSVHVDFYGNGPVRSFSGLLDYGPHALAFVADLLGSCALPRCDKTRVEDELRGIWKLEGEIGNVPVSVTTGNWERMGTGRRVEVRAAGEEHVWRELQNCGDDRVSQEHEYWVHRNTRARHWHYPEMEHHRGLALRSFCRAFLSGEPSDTLRLSCEAMKVLMPLVT